MGQHDDGAILFFAKEKQSLTRPSYFRCLDTITFSSSSSSVTPVLESLACCCDSPTIPTLSLTFPPSVLTLYVDPCPHFHEIIIF